MRVDHGALVRGHSEPGEICEIDGLGPVPVAIVSQMLDDAFVKLLLIDGTDVWRVSHPGRFVGAHLRSALEERYPNAPSRAATTPSTSRSTTTSPSSSAARPRCGT